MKEVVIIKTINGSPTDEQPDFLSQRYARILGYYKRIELELKKDRGDTCILLERLLELKSDLECLERALNGKHNIIVVVDSAGDNQKRVNKEA